jgi:hypothetical protein
MSAEKTGFIYIWFDIKRKMYYIGCHIGDENDDYICSSNRMRDAYRRRPQDFKRRIIKRNIKRDILLDEEYKWLQLISDDDLGIKYYNLSKKHFGHWSKDKEISQSIVEKRKKTLETSIAWKKFQETQKGKIISEETKEKLRQKATQQFSDPENRKKAGLKNIGNTYKKGKKASAETIEKMRIAGKNKSNETIEKMRQSLTGRKLSEETRQKMRGPRGPQKNPRKKGNLQ